MIKGIQIRNTSVQEDLNGLTTSENTDNSLRKALDKLKESSM